MEEKNQTRNNLFASKVAQRSLKVREPLVLHLLRSRGNVVGSLRARNLDGILDICRHKALGKYFFLADINRTGIDSLQLRLANVRDLELADGDGLLDGSVGNGIVLLLLANKQKLIVQEDARDVLSRLGKCERSLVNNRLGQEEKIALLHKIFFGTNKNIKV